MSYLFWRKGDGSQEKLGLAYITQANTRYFAGDLLGSEENFRYGEPLFDVALKELRPSAIVYGFASHNAWMLGGADLARTRMQKQLTSAAELDYPFQIAFANYSAARLELWLKEMEAAQRFAEESIRVSIQNGFTIIADASRMFLWRAWASLGRAGDGVSLIKEAASRLPETDRNAMTNYLGLLAEAEALDHDVTEAQATIERALEVNPLQRAWWIEALTIRAELRVADGKPDLGEADFREAMDRAGEIGAKAFELRAAVGLARLIYGRDRKAASVLLAQIYATFSEGFDTADIKDAKALLDELNGKPSTLIRLPDSTNNNNV